MTRPTHATVSAIADLSALVDTARDFRHRAKILGMAQSAEDLRGLARDLDAARTALVADGEDALDDALDAIDYAADELAEYASRLGRVTGHTPAS